MAKFWYCRMPNFAIRSSLTRTAKTILVVLFVAAPSIPATAQWQRLVFGGKGNTMDTPSQHPLSYFTANPFLRDETDDLCGLCTPVGKEKSAQRYLIRTEVKPVGVLAGYRILDVLFYVGSLETNTKLTEVKWKSILVQVGP